MSGKKGKRDEPENSALGMLSPGETVRAIGMSGKVYGGVILSTYDDGFMLEQPNRDIVIIMHAGLESLWQGLEPAKEAKNEA